MTGLVCSLSRQGTEMQGSSVQCVATDLPPTWCPCLQLEGHQGAERKREEEFYEERRVIRELTCSQAAQAPSCLEACWPAAACRAQLLCTKDSPECAGPKRHGMQLTVCCWRAAIVDGFCSILKAFRRLTCSWAAQAPSCQAA